MLQNSPNLDKLYQNNDILPRFLLHNAQNITIRGSSVALIFVALIVDNFCGILFYFYIYVHSQINSLNALKHSKLNNNINLWKFRKRPNCALSGRLGRFRGSKMLLFAKKATAREDWPISIFMINRREKMVNQVKLTE